MKKLPHQLGWRTVLQWLNELPEDEWITPSELGELYHIPFMRAHHHLASLHKWLMADKETFSFAHGKKTKYRINDRGKHRLETMKQKMWCTCAKGGTCMGCQIEITVQLHYGTIGKEYLLKHLLC